MGDGRFEDIDYNFTITTAGTRTGIKTSIDMFSSKKSMCPGSHSVLTDLWFLPLFQVKLTLGVLTEKDNMKKSCTLPTIYLYNTLYLIVRIM